MYEWLSADDLERRRIVADESEEVLVRPRAFQREAVHDLVQRHPRPELDRIDAPVPLELRDVRDHEVQTGGARSGNGHVVLPERPLTERAEHGARLSAE